MQEFGLVWFGLVRFGSVRFGSGLVWFRVLGQFGSVGSVWFGSVWLGSVRFGAALYAATPSAAGSSTDGLLGLVRTVCAISA